jgi:hypothetical protein
MSLSLTTSNESTISEASMNATTKQPDTGQDDVIDGIGAPEYLTPAAVAEFVTIDATAPSGFTRLDVKGACVLLLDLSGGGLGVVAAAWTSPAPPSDLARAIAAHARAITEAGLPHDSEHAIAEYAALLAGRVK